jgi:tetratricopeptide (TPR) repeat protein
MLVDRPEYENQATLEPPAPTVSPLGLRWGAQGERPIDSRAEAFFAEQSELIELEKARLRERRWKDRASLALQAIGVIVGASLVVAVGAMVWSARQDHGLVIQPFSVPPDLAARGLTGPVVASKLLDKLSTMQSRAVSSRPADSYRNNWGDNLEVDSAAPAGLTIGLDRWLHARLSQQTRVSGEVVETAQGLSLTARTEQGGDSFAAGPGDLDKLLQQSAEAIYRRAQPYRYAVYLMTVGQMDQGLELLTQLGNGPAGPDRVWANAVLGNLLVARGETAAGLARNLDAVRAEPKDPHAWATLATSLNSLGHAEGALAATKKSDGLLRSHPSAEAAGYTQLALIQNQASLAALAGDFRAAADRDARASVLPGDFGDGGASRAQAVADLAQAHDAAGSDTARAEAMSMRVQDIVLLPSLLEADLALGRYGDAVRDGEALEGVAAEPASFQAWLERGWVLRVELAKLAYAHAMAGDLDGAGVIAAQTPADCYDCLRMRGRIAAVARNWLQAERWFDQATRSAPSLPFAWTDWGRMRLARGDFSGAITVLKTAHDKGPRFADPLELWGEALMAGHDYAGAAGKFSEADHYAPAWGKNHLLWGEALMLSGRYREARAQYEAADALSLSRPDRAALKVLLARTASGRLRG